MIAGPFHHPPYITAAGLCVWTIVKPLRVVSSQPAHRRFFTPDLARLETSSAILSAFHVDQVVPEAALWQMGYLTIREEREVVTGIWVYTLGYPNREVEIALHAALLPALFRVPGAAVPAGRRPS
jgi:hypothetical protein